MISENAVDSRAKNFLTEAEVASFFKAVRKGSHSVRNYAMVLLAFRHGLRVSELINLRVPDLDLDTGRLFVRRVKVFRQATRWMEMKFAPCERGCGSESMHRAAIRRWSFCQSAGR